MLGLSRLLLIYSHIIAHKRLANNWYRNPHEREGSLAPSIGKSCKLLPLTCRLTDLSLYVRFSR